MWHIQDSQGQILALDLRQTSLKCFELFPLRPEEVSYDAIGGCKGLFQPGFLPWWMQGFTGEGVTGLDLVD